MSLDVPEGKSTIIYSNQTPQSFQQLEQFPHWLVKLSKVGSLERKWSFFSAIQNKYFIYFSPLQRIWNPLQYNHDVTRNYSKLGGTLQEE